MRRFLLTIIAGWVVWVVSPTVLADETNALPAAMTAPAQWPEPTNVSRPWTRWWWLGSAVDDEDLTRLLETYQQAGLGGVEITSIYGVQGADDRELPFLSKEWVAALRHSVVEAKRLGMGVDLPTGSGWRTGGPSVSDEDANAELVLTSRSIDGGKLLELTFDDLPQALVAVGDDGQSVDLGKQIASGKLAWDAPPGKWTLYTASERWSKDNVKRPAPGGEGKNINPLSQRSIEHFLDYFGQALGDVPAAGIRAQFHDSYEYEGNWCDDFFAQFETRRGYRLQDHLPALHGDGNPDDVARVKHDYRETVSDLIRDNMIGPWTEWSHEHGMISRNQSHGSPANWLDLYAACDIPEIESFGRLKGGDTNPLVFKFASSAAHVTGKPLISSESATWLEEHFNETLGEVKEIVDRLFLGGVNHIFYHGTAYSPADAAWPGWLFYASTQFNPQNPIWRDFAVLNEYVTRVQSVLQSTKPDNDILLYWPIHEYWQDPKGLRKDLRVHNSRQWLDDTDFGQIAEWLYDHGYSFDYISDRQLMDCEVVDGQIRTSGGTYAMVLIPGTQLMPLGTAEKLNALAKAGGSVAFRGFPSEAPGLQSPGKQQEFRDLIDSWIRERQTSNTDGHRSVMQTTDLRATLAALGIRQEAWSEEKHLRFQRRAWNDGHLYFIKNNTDQDFDGRIEFAVDFAAALLMDPLSGRIGLADAESSSNAVRLQLAPGQAMIVKTYRGKTDAPEWKYQSVVGQPAPIDGLWGVEFIEGGPVLPPPVNTHRLASWSEIAGPDGERFGGMARYTIHFTPDADAKKYLLDLGNVAESARVELNGKPVATLIGPPYRVEIEPRLAENNLLTIEVTSTAANRIRDLDRRGVKWRIFKDINLVGIDYRPFDASKWPVRDAGLLGPVTLTPLAE